MKKKLLKTIPKLATPTPMMPKRDFGSKTNFDFFYFFLFTKFGCTSTLVEKVKSSSLVILSGFWHRQSSESTLKDGKHFD